jgi:hypothetical protein
MDALRLLLYCTVSFCFLLLCLLPPGATFASRQLRINFQASNAARPGCRVVVLSVASATVSRAKCDFVARHTDDTGGRVYTQ